MQARSCWGAGVGNTCLPCVTVSEAYSRWGGEHMSIILHCHWEMLSTHWQDVGEQACDTQAAENSVMMASVENVLQGSVDVSEVRQVFPYGRVAVEVVTGGLRAPPALENGSQLSSMRMHDACCHQRLPMKPCFGNLCHYTIILRTLCTQQASSGAPGTLPSPQ